jgi:hypothetical protein
MHRRLGVTAVAVLLGLVTPATARAVTVPEEISLPPAKTGAASEVTVAFAAEGDTEVMGAAVVDGDPAFTLGEDTCSSREVVGSCTITVRFAPSAVGERQATLRLPGARGEAAVRLTATGYVVGPRLSVSPAVLTFQPLGRGLLSPPKQGTVTADGDLPVHITALAFEGPSPGDFVVTQDGCTRTVLAPGEACRIEVRSNPSGFAGGVARLRVLTDPLVASATIGVVAEAAAPSGGGGGGGGGSTPPPPPRLIPPPWSLGIVAVRHSARRTTIRLYSSLPARLTVALRRGGHTVRSRRRRISGGLIDIVVRGRLRRGRYRVQVVALRPSARRTDSVRLRVR